MIPEDIFFTNHLPDAAQLEDGRTVAPGLVSQISDLEVTTSPRGPPLHFSL